MLTDFDLNGEMRLYSQVNVSLSGAADEKDAFCVERLCAVSGGAEMVSNLYVIVLVPFHFFFVSANNVGSSLIGVG